MATRSNPQEFEANGVEATRWLNSLDAEQLEGLCALVDEADASGPTIPAAAVFAELRALNEADIRDYEQSRRG